jgi:hypothetical protein
VQIAAKREHSARNQCRLVPTQIRQRGVFDVRRVTFLLGVLCLALLGSRSIARAESLFYEKDIRPIFRAHCFDCHGATKQLKGELDLKLVRLMAKGGESGPAIVPSKPQFLSTQQ